ncbi:hypothetical protein [Actinokineospora enzanensis]|uniref:hypothetical protein n=1 Tax=Actinokineospora enzanensis TaxID=155975 RepID=UPI00036D7325|nr:hypothetical protein [Actinokineospora enzanensis]
MALTAIAARPEESWPHYGGMVEASWETTSTQDPDILAELLGDVAWSNEALFAMLQGLRRPAETNGQLVSIPPIDWEISE